MLSEVTISVTCPGASAMGIALHNLVRNAITAYAPAQHQPGKIHDTKSNAASDTDNEPAEWSVQHPATHPDQHG